MRRIGTLAIVLAVGVLAACGDAVARAEPTSPSLSIAPAVSIFGPSTVRPNRSCEWIGTISNGEAPFSWTWSRTGGSGTSEAISDTQQSYIASPGTATSITVTITDALGRTSSATKPVSLATSAPLCLV